MKLKQRLFLFIGKNCTTRFRNDFFRMAGMKIGSKTWIASGMHVDCPSRLSLGKNSFVNHFVHFHNGADPDARIIIGNNVFIGPEVKFICASHKIGTSERRAGKNTYGSIIVEDGAWIGAGAIILPNCTIGHGSIIGAGALVNKSTEPNTMNYGIPAKKIKDLSEPKR